MTSPNVTIPEFKGWPKIHRFNRNVTITEKIDGSNACLIVTPEGELFTQSRKRLISPATDNFGFARWAQDRKDLIVEEFGVGYHFGEWAGLGIQRNYGLDHKVFVPFNYEHESTIDGVEKLPVMWQGTADRLNHGIQLAMSDLGRDGSHFVRGFPNAEGIVIYHHAGNVGFKVTFEGDDASKWEMGK